MKITGNQWVEIIRAISTAIIAIITTLCQSVVMIAIIAVEIARIISTHCVPLIFIRFYF